MYSRSVRLTVLAASIAGILASAQAGAETQLEEITVTAQKREENIQEVPLSVTSFNAEQLLPLAEGAADVKFLSCSRF